MEKRTRTLDFCDRKNWRHFFHELCRTLENDCDDRLVMAEIHKKYEFVRCYHGTRANVRIMEEGLHLPTPKLFQRLLSEALPDMRLTCERVEEMMSACGRWNSSIHLSVCAILDGQELTRDMSASFFRGGSETLRVMSRQLGSMAEEKVTNWLKSLPSRVIPIDIPMEYFIAETPLVDNDFWYGFCENDGARTINIYCDVPAKWLVWS